MLRKVRAILFTALLWGFLWSLVGAGIGVVRWWRNDLIDVIGPPPGVILSIIGGIAVRWGMLGAINGALFAIVLALAEKRGSIATMSLARFALWGAVATVVVPAIVLGMLLIMVPSGDLFFQFLPVVFLLALGAVCSAGMLWLSRRERSSVSR